ncbi:autotransporter outer membrane beta-barrel domain-containing protein [Termitidicoccus mucosus]
MKSAIRPPAALTLRPLLRGLPLFALGLLLPLAASAATYTVTDGGDDQPTGTTQLRAILANSATNPGDEIHFAGVVTTSTDTTTGTTTTTYTGTTIYLSGSALRLDKPGLTIGNVTTGTVYLTGTTVVSDTTTGVATGTITGTVAQNTTLFTTISGSGQSHILDITGDVTSGTLRNLHLDSGSNAASGGAIVNNGGSFAIVGSNYTFSGSDMPVTISDTTFTGTLTGSATATVNISSTIANNTADNNGGAIYNGPGGSITFDLVAITSNSAGNNGGAILNETGATLDFSRSSITGNTALTSSTSTVGTGTDAQEITTLTGEGGGIYNKGYVRLSGSTLVSSNYSGSNGGGIYNAASGTLVQTITGISNNTTGTAGSGGGVYNAGLYNSSSATLQGNSAGDSGGGLYNIAAASLNSVFFYNNAAGHNGGAIYNSGTLVIDGTSNLNANIASGTHGRGGAIHNRGDLTLADVRMSGNYAGEFGGALYHESSTPLVITNALLIGNSAGVSTGTTGASAAGGAIYNNGGDITLADVGFQNNFVVTSSNTTALGGGAIYNDNGHVGIVISASTTQSYAGNYVAESGTRQNSRGGFLYMAGTNATATFDIGAGGTLIIGGTTVESSTTALSGTTDSIASGSASNALITKTGAGTLVLHADNSHYTGTFALQEGVLAVSVDENLFGGGLSGITFTGTDGTAFIDFLATGTFEGGGTTALQRLVNSAATTAGYIISGTTAKTVTIANNTTTGTGGVLHNSGTFALDSGAGSFVFASNTAANGGAIANLGVFDSGTSRLSFTGNTATGTVAGAGNGGAINNTGTLTLSNATFSGNTGTHGGAIYNTGVLNLAPVMLVTISTTVSTDPDDSSIITGTTTTTTSIPATLSFSDNKANLGGAIHDATGTLTLANATFSKNKALATTTTVSSTTTGTDGPVVTTTTVSVPGTGDGGAIYAASGLLALATISGSTTIEVTDTAGLVTSSTTTFSRGSIAFTENTADGYGGAIYTLGGTIALDAAGGEISFSGNTHKQSGATATPNAIYSASAAALLVSGTHNVYIDDSITSAAATGNTLVKNGAGTLRFGGTSVWAGSAAINEGVLALKDDASLDLTDASDSAAGLDLATGAVITTATTGTSVLKANHFNIQGTLHATGSGVLQLTGSTMLDGATIALDLLSTGSDAGLVYIDGDIGYGALTDINIAQWQGSGTFNILQSTDTIDDTKFNSPLLEGGVIPGVRMIASTTLVTTASDSTLQLITDSDSSRLVTWTGASGSFWSLTGINWDDGFHPGNVETVPGDLVRFTSGTAAVRDIEITSVQITTSGMIVEGDDNYSFSGSGRIVTGTGYAIDSEITPTGKLIKNGSGTLAFTNAGNDFAEGIELNGGVISITNGDQLHISGTAEDNRIHVTATAVGAAIHAHASLDFTTPVVLDGALTLAATGTSQFILGGTTTIITGTGNLTLTTFNSTGTAEDLSDQPRIQLQAPLAHTGDTIITQALVQTNTADVLSPSSHLRITTGGTLSLFQNQTVPALTLADTASLIINAAGTGTAALGAQLTTGDLFTTGTSTTIKLGINHYANTNDTLRITGTAVGDFKIEWLNSFTITDTGTSISLAHDTYRVIIVEGDATAATFTADPVESGAFVYDLIQAARDYELVRSGRPSSAAAAILNTASILGMEWHYSLDTLQGRMGDLRANAAVTFDPRGNLWVRANAYHLDADPDLSGTPFKQDTYSVTLGGDKAFRLGDSTLLGGVFVGTGRTSRDFSNGGDGDTDNIAAGFYASWFHRDGWYADAILKGDHNKNKFNSRSSYGVADHAAYNSTAIGFSLELGRHFEIDFSPRLKLPSVWIEPSAQVAVAWLSGKNYVTDKGIRADLESAIALQGRLQVAAGTVFATRWRPYVRLGLAGGSTSGGTMRTDGVSFDPEFGGTRAEAGLGLSYILNERSQLYLDYEYNKADNYERPWSAGLGFRYMW